MNVTRHNAYFALPGRYYARAVWPDKPASSFPQIILYSNHVEDGDTFGYADYQFYSRISRLIYSVGAESGRYVNHRCVCARIFNRVSDRVEHRDTLYGLAGFAR